jgi:hypothetical protein
MDASTNRFKDFNDEFAGKGSASAPHNGDSPNQDEAPRPLMRELPPAEPYPVEALGYALRPAAEAIQRVVQCPMAICAQSVLATSALTAQGLANVQLPMGHIKPVSLYLLSIAESGERKSTADDEALGPIHSYEESLRVDYGDRLQGYKNDKEAWDKAREDVKKKHKSDRRALKEALDHLGAPPRPPMTPSVTSGEPTIEGLHKSYIDGCPSHGIFSDEGGQFIAGHAMRDDRRTHAGAALSDLWQGKPIKRLRGGEGTLILPNRRLSVFLQVQPDVASLWLADQMLISQGLVSRLLCCRPESAIGDRPWKDPSQEAALDRYRSRIGHLIRLTPTDNLENGLDKLPVMRLSEEAKRAWVAFYNYVEAAQKNGGALESIRGFASKIAENAVRITGVLHMMEEGDAAKEISQDAMERGIEIAQHYLDEALRLRLAAHTDPQLRLAQRAVEWIMLQPGGMFCLPDLYQFGPCQIITAGAARKIVEILEDHALLERLAGAHEINGRKRREVWRLRK